MKSASEVRAMLAEAKEKYAAANSMLKLEYGEAVWNENLRKRDIAEAEIKCFAAVLGTDIFTKD